VIKLGEYGVQSVKITENWIKAHGTQRGGWTRAQLALIGVAWPPEKGWLSGAKGRVISDEAARKFEVLGKCSPKLRAIDDDLGRLEFT